MFIKEGYRQLEVVLSNYGIYGLKSGEVYRLEVTAKDKKRGIENVNIVVNADPSNATIYLNNKKVDNPRQISAPIGKNDIRIEFDGYKPIVEEIDVSEENTFFEYQLELSMDVPVTIETEPAGANISLNNIDCGKTPKDFFYQEGEYRITLTLEDYATVEEAIEIKGPQTKKKYILEDISGYLTIKTAPNAKIYIDDEYHQQGVNRLKISPRLVHIKVTAPKAQDIVQSLLIEKKKHHEIELYPVFDTGTVGINVMPIDAQVDLIGDGGEKFSFKGSQTVREVPIGKYRLTIWSEGYMSHQESFEVAKDDVIRKQIVLNKGMNVGEQYELGNRYYAQKEYNKAVEYFLKAAEEGHADAQHKLGDCYKEGEGVIKNTEEAAKWYRYAAEQGHIEAQYRLGEHFGNAGKSRDAEKWYRLAADKGHTEAQYSLGWLYDAYYHNYKDSVYWYSLAAEKGHLKSQKRLGYMLLRGYHAIQNVEEAAKWYRMAAEQGDADAQYDLGRCYVNKTNIQDYKEAVKWFRMAAEQGHKTAQYNLGKCYEQGQGVAKSFEDAYFWYTIALLNDYGYFEGEREEVGFKLTPSVAAKIQKEAEQWLEDFEKKKQ